MFMNNLLELFSTDRGLLDSRGSLIIRQLCLNLNTERIYRTFAEILEKEEDLEFASVMVQKLNMILITSPELADFRRRLKSLETRVSIEHVSSDHSTNIWLRPMGKLYSRHCIGRGAIMPLLSFPYVSSLRRTSTHQISCTSCKSPSNFELRASIAIYESFLSVRISRLRFSCWFRSTSLFN